MHISDPAGPAPPDAPLPDRMRPRTLEEYIGQRHLLGSGKILKTAMETGDVRSIILWGPPGTGKTTIARLIAMATKHRFIPFSAVLSGIKEVKEVMAQAERERRRNGTKTLLFIDEIHRFNRAQQDAFLPYVEKGDVILIGATTENPSFEVVGALLSRSKVLILEPLSIEDLITLQKRALSDRERGLGAREIIANDDALEVIAHYASGDARRALATLEVASAFAKISASGKPELTKEGVAEALQHKSLLYDRSGDEHYNLISALHKSVRDSDPDAAAYWCLRMLESGEDPLFVARRLVRMASEDIGLADPAALAVSLHAKEAFEFLGVPEGNLALAQAAIYLALAPKSNAAYAAENIIKEDLQSLAADPVPLHLRNAPTKLMKNAGFGEGYQYAHDFEGGVAGMQCLPDRLKNRKYYNPTDRGFEKKLKERMAEIEKLRKKNF
ncbi:MAG: replication-associated recombination protein A [Planctomycetota bacterium]